MKKVLCSLVGLALSGSVALAEVPDPQFCEVVPADNLGGLVLCPDVPAPIPSTINTITVRNSSNNPIANASVVVTIAASHFICGSTVLTGTTDGAGEVVITLGGGGCSHNVPLSGLVKAQGVTIRDFSNVKSPDYDGASGDGLVNLTDLVPFSAEFTDAAPNECHDYDNNGDTALPDLVIFSLPFSNPNSCAP
jgi:hypothetical protein